jgi:hypothetical protein
MSMVGWNDNWQEKPTYSKKTCLSTNLFTANFTLPDLGQKTGHRGEKSVTDCLSYGTTIRASSHVELHVRFEGMYYCYPQVRKCALQATINKQKALGLLHASCTLVVFYIFDPEDGGSIFLCNICELLPDYTASHHTREYSSQNQCFVTT